MSIPSDAGAIEFRTIDGSFNNLSEPGWGMPGEPLFRLTPPAYADGISAPRTGTPGPLPGAREVSNAVASQSGRVDNRRKATDWLWQWGQFLDHDLDHTGTDPRNEYLDIPVPAGDAFFDPGNTGTRTMGFKRSHYVDVPPPAGDPGPAVRQQVNEITAYIDASNVYGSDIGTAGALRGADGLMLMQTGPNGEALLSSDHAGFFRSGDSRANEQIALTAVHTLFSREHNRLAGQIRTRLASGEGPLVTARDAAILAPGNGIDDEGDFVYEATRKVVGAQIQKITYQEFLPVLLGASPASLYTPASYNPEVTAAVGNEFSAAAFRLGHTMLSPELLRVRRQGGSETVTQIALRNAFFNPSEVFANGVDSLLLGLARQKAQAIDTLLVDDVRNFLFGDPGAGGFDLAALNVQRGRDHGIGSLNAVRDALGLGRHGSFLDMTGGDGALATQFDGIYGSVDDVDLWVGALAESQYGRSMLGETLTRILSDQFMRSMIGDRFFYLSEQANLRLFDPGFFGHTSLSEIISRNTSVTGIQANVFLMVPEPSAVILGALAVAGVYRTSRRKTGKA